MKNVPIYQTRPDKRNLFDLVTFSQTNEKYRRHMFTPEKCLPKKEKK